jgi:hypothetical protein
MFLGQMELAVEEDEMSIAERRPAVKKPAAECKSCKSWRGVIFNVSC